jgi:hypothetical protein
MKDETNIEKTYANGYVAGPGRLGTTKIDENRTVKLFKADGGGFVIKGETVGKGAESIGLSDEAMLSVITMYMNMVEGSAVQKWDVEITKPELVPQEA